MKKIKSSSAVMLLLLTIIIVSCKKEKFMTYNGFDNIYFNYKPTGAIVDNGTLTFAFAPLKTIDTTFNIPVQITGPASANDRTYNVKVDTGTTAVAGKHYILPANFIMGKNKIADTLKVKLLRTADEQIQVATLRLTLQPSSDLHIDLKSIVNYLTNVPTNVLSFKLFISDMLVKDNLWDNFFGTYFGVWSPKKMRLINQVTGMPLDYTTAKGFQDPNLQAGLTYYAIVMANYLNNQKLAGNTIYESDGVTPMTMGAAYK